MKIKYYRLSKEERKEYKDKFYKTKAGKKLKKYSTISYVADILLIILGIYYIIDTYINKTNKLFYYYGALVIVLGLILTISVYKLRVNKINDFIVKK